MRNINKVLNVKLQDDGTAFGGVSFSGETVKDFLGDTNLSENDSIKKLNIELVANGIKPIEKGDKNE